MKTILKKAKQTLALFLAVLMIVPLTASFAVPATAELDLDKYLNAEVDFVDVSSDASYYEAVKLCYNIGVMDVLDDGGFYPDQTITRGEFCDTLYNIAVVCGNVDPTDIYDDCPFADVPEDSPYRTAITWACDNGYVSGIGFNANGDTLFGWQNSITREQLAMFFYVYFSSNGYDVSDRADISVYADSDRVHLWAEDAVSWAVSNGIMIGYGYTLDPRSTATRADLATYTAAALPKLLGVTPPEILPPVDDSQSCDHEWSEWYVEIPADKWNNGVEFRVCFNCDYMEYRETPRIEGVQENAPIVLPNADPGIDGFIHPGEGWSDSAWLDENTALGSLNDNAVPGSIDFKLAYTDTGLYFAANVCGGMFVPSTGEDDIDGDYSWNGDVVGISFDLLGEWESDGFLSDEDYAPRYDVTMFEDGSVRIASNTNGISRDITDSCVGAGNINGYDGVFEVMIPWEIIVDDQNRLGSNMGLSKWFTVEDVIAEGATHRAAVSWQDRDYDYEAGCPNTYNRFVTVCAMTAAGTPGFGDDIKSMGLTLSIGERIPSQSCNHEWSEWFVEVPADQWNDGLEFRWCNYCGKTEYKTVSIRGKYPVEGGYIYFLKDSGIVFDCDESVISADIPAVIDGVEITCIDAYAFEGCNSLVSVGIPESVTQLSGFSGCSSLMYVEVDGDNENYADIDAVLFNKDKTELIYYPAGRSGAYTVPNGVTSIGSCSFWHNDAITAVVLPDTITRIGTDAFWSCDSLESVNLPSTLTTIEEGAFGECRSLKSVVIPGSVKVIGRNVFMECASLENVVILDGVTTIDNSAFYYSKSISTITIPKTVTSIGNSAFYPCYALTDVYYSGTEKDWNNITVGKNNEYLLNATIHFQKPSDENAPQLVVSTAEGCAGETVTVTVDLKNNPGFAGMNAYLSYSDGLILREVTNHTDLTFTNDKTMVWDGISNHNGDGELLTLVFDIAEDAELGERLVSINFLEAFNEALDELTFVTIDGFVNVVDYIYGDVDGDGKISTRDIILLRQYISSKDPITGESNVEMFAGADADGDGKISTRDIILLRQYISSKDPITGESSVVLGPQK